MKTTFLFILCCCYQFVQSQNLIPNPSFEESNTCYKYKEQCSPKAWRPTTLKGIRYNEFLGDRHKVKPPDGNRYISLIMHNAKKAEDRKFIQAPLACPLIAGKSYRFSLYFKTQSTIVERFGVYFPQELKILSNNLPLLKITPQIVLECDDNMPVNQWQKLEGSFIATGKEQGIIVGNFFSDEQSRTKLLKRLTKKQLKKNPPKSICYYSFDLFSLVAQDSTLGDCDLDKNIDFLYGDTTRHIIVDQPITIVDLPIVVTPPVHPIKKDSVETQITKKVPITPAIPVDRSFILEHVLFESNSTKLLPIAHAALLKIVEVLQKEPSYQLQIIGHTDDIGSVEANLLLSQGRAKSVADFLISQGISPNRLKASGRGELEPISDNLTAASRQKNRRVEFLIIK